MTNRTANHQELDRQYAIACTKQEAYNRIQHEFLQAYPVGGTPKQKDYAKMIASDFLYTPHAYRQFTPAELEAVLETVKSSFFWIGCKPRRLGSYASEQKEAIAKRIAEMKRDQEATAEAKAAIAAMSTAQVKQLVRRFA